MSADTGISASTKPKPTIMPSGIVTPEKGLYVLQRLNSLLGHEEHLTSTQDGLLRKWGGAFAPLDMREARLMVENAGEMYFVLRSYKNNTPGTPLVVAEATILDVNGDPQKLVQTHPKYNHIVRPSTWQLSIDPEGDTAIFLQLTTLEEESRRRGIGSVSRSAVFYYTLPPHVRFVLTTTPVSDKFNFEGITRLPTRKLDEMLGRNYPTVNFHYRAGAEIAGYEAKYKEPAPTRPKMQGRQNYEDVVFMLYRRLANGDWLGIARPTNVARWL